jgi:hypothetical protein
VSGLQQWNGFVAGATAMAAAVAATLFWHFYRSTRDRLFALFAVSFALMALNRVLMAVLVGASDNATPLYLLRLMAFALILVAIVDKNRAR